MVATVVGEETGSRISPSPKSSLKSLMFWGVTWLEMKMESTKRAARPPDEQLARMDRAACEAGTLVDTRAVL